MAAHADHRLGDRGYIARHRPKPGWLLRRSVLLGSRYVGCLFCVDHFDPCAAMSRNKFDGHVRPGADRVLAESGLFPGVVYYFSMWYKRRERQFRISLFFSAAALAGSFGGILAYVRETQRSLKDKASLTLSRVLASCEESFGLMAGDGFLFS